MNDRWAQDLGRFRDALLVFGAGVYVLGYAVWAIYSWKNNLGLRSALDVQYFTAGFIPALILAVVIVGTRALSSLIDFVVRFESRLPPSLGITLNLGFLALVAWWLSRFSGALSSTKSPWMVLVLGFGTALLVLVVVALSQRQPRFGRVDWESRYPRGTARPWYAFGKGFGVGTSVMVLMLTGIYATEWFQLIPQELGGGAPRCAQLDVVPKEIGPQARYFFSSAEGEQTGTQNQLFSRWIDSDNARIETTAKVHVWTFTDDYILVTSGVEKLLGRSLELPRDHVRAIGWCSERL